MDFLCLLGVNIFTKFVIIRCLLIFFFYRVIQKQMAFMLGRHGMFLELNEDVEDYEDLTEIMSNVQLNSNFLALAREVRKTPETQPCGLKFFFFILLVICTKLFNYWDGES